MPRTKTDDVLAAAEIHHAHDPERAEMIARVRRFKASWFELGNPNVETICIDLAYRWPERRGKTPRAK